MKKTLIIILLISWIIAGFVLDIGLSQDVGCIDFPEDNLYKYKVGFALISSVLLISGYIFKNSKVESDLFISEFLLWIGILFFIKGGYAIGIGGTANPGILLYDFLGLLLRIGNLVTNVNLKFLPSSNKRRQLIILLAAFLLIIIKVNFFDFPWITLR